MKKPLKKDYCTQTAMTAMMNANEGTEKYVYFDSKSYAKDAEKYIEHLEKIMRLTSGNLRDLAISVNAGHLLSPEQSKVNSSSCHDLADRLYNATI